MEALVGTFNQKSALVGAFSVIVKTDCVTDGSLTALTPAVYPGHGPPVPGSPMSVRSGLVQSSPYRGITVLTGEGGKLKNNGKLQRGRDYELVPERLWKFLVQMYGGAPPLPRQVIRSRAGAVELELNPLSARILKHQARRNRPTLYSLHIHS